MTLDRETHEERTAILTEDPAITNPAQQAALQIALAMWCVDKATTLTPTQREWLQAKVLAGTLLTPQEITRLTPELLAWADALNPDFGQVLREVLGLARRPPVERPRNLAWEAGRGQGEIR